MTFSILYDISMRTPRLEAEMILCQSRRDITSWFISARTDVLGDLLVSFHFLNIFWWVVFYFSLEGREKPGRARASGETTVMPFKV